MPDTSNLHPSPENYDFKGWATKYDILCSDKRVIRPNAFAHQDGNEVPVIWNHRHDTPDAVIGKAVLYNKPNGVYCYGLFNGTRNGKMCDELVRHGDITSLSILANKLKQSGRDVVHGMIREVSLVLAGANSGAFIEDVNLSHADDAEYDARIFANEPILCHGDEDPEFGEENPAASAEKGPEEEPQAQSNQEGEPEVKPEDQNGGTEPMAEEGKLQHAEGSEKTVQDVINSMSEEQKNVMYALIAQVLEEKKEDNSMAHNAFEGGCEMTAGITKDQFDTILRDGKRLGSLKEAVLAHSEDMDGLSATLEHADYGIENIDYLFPDDRNVTREPIFIQRDMGWVTGVMQGVNHRPFSRIKSIFADITADEARARGYLKGKLKKEEVFTLLKRSTGPQTIYKKQKLDRDDIIDIVDFSVVAWLKSEMRMMLNEEIARAVLIGDGRSTASDDKIKEDCIRPIWKDAELYTIDTIIKSADFTTEDALAKEFIRQSIKSRKNYKGSGNPTLFTTEDMLTNMLLLEDGIGHRLYKTEEELRTALRVSKIVTVPVMENQTRDVAHDDSKTYTHTLMGIIVNLADYTVGADKGGAVSMFDDFDIDYNQEKYLIETRCSGALTKPYSAIVIESYAEKAAG